MATKTTIPVKSTGDALTAAEFNQLNSLYNASVDDINGFIDGGKLEEYGITGDGVTDDTAAIQAYATALKTAGGGELYLPKSTYIIKGTITIPSNVLMRGDGDGTIIKLGDAFTLTPVIFRDPSVIYPYITTEADSSGITFRDFTIYGNTNIEYWGNMHAGLGIFDTENCVVENVNCLYINYNPDYEGLSVTGFGMATLRASNVLINGGRYEYAGYECAGALDYSENVVFDKIYCNVGWRTCFQVHKGCVNIKLVNSTIIQNFPIAGAAVTFHGVEGDSIHGFHMINNYIDATISETIDDAIAAVALDDGGTPTGCIIHGNTIKCNNTGINMTGGDWLVLGNNIHVTSGTGLIARGTGFIDGNIVLNDDGANYSVGSGTPTWGTNLNFDIE